jgi:formylmethanofuran:tetrahydromethanopterin formyltransferase
MKVGAVSGDLIIELSIAAGVIAVMYYGFEKLADTVKKTLDSAEKAVTDAVQTVTGAVQTVTDSAQQVGTKSVDAMQAAAVQTPSAPVLAPVAATWAFYDWIVGYAKSQADPFTIDGNFGVTDPNAGW